MEKARLDGVMAEVDYVYIKVYIIIGL